MLCITVFFALLIAGLPPGRHERDGDFVMMGIGLFMLGLAALAGTNRWRRPLRWDNTDSERMKAVGMVLLGWLFVAGAVIRIVVDLT